LTPIGLGREVQNMQPVMITLLATSLFASWPAAAECTCTYKGGKVSEGRTACIGTVAGPSLARCVKVQNVTSWEILNRPCSVFESRVKSTMKPKTTTRNRLKL
jgi:hypothetical protein